MSTTTIRLPEDLKSRVTAAAERNGTTAHSFILEAIAEKTEQEERRSDFEAECDRRYTEFLETGESIPWDDMRHYLEALKAGKRPTPPKARKLVR